MINTLLGLAVLFIPAVVNLAITKKTSTLLPGMIVGSGIGIHAKVLPAWVLVGVITAQVFYLFWRRRE